MDQPAYDAWVGKPFGRYQILSPLGRAGAGQTYRALDTTDNRAVALTLLSPALDRERFHREVRIAANLTEPHVVAPHDWGENAGLCYVATRLVAGDTLQSLVATFGPIDVARAVAIIEQIASALDAAHADRLIHRDIRPENILLGDGGTAYLLGAGVSDPSAAEPTADSYAYLGPERFSDGTLTNRADVYALAAVLAEILTGERPFPNATTVSQMIQAHLREAPPKPSLLRPHVISVRFDAVIARGMAKNPQHRFATAGDLARAAREVLPTFGDAPTMVRVVGDAGAPPEKPPAKAPGPAPIPAWVAAPAWWRSKLLLGAIGAVLLLLVGVVGWRISMSDQTSAPSSYRQEVLPLTGLTGPEGVAVDAAGAIYVSNVGIDRVMKLVFEPIQQSVLPFTNLREPYGLAVDSEGSVYVADTTNGRVVKLAAGSAQQTVLPFTGLNHPRGLAVDESGSVYVVDTGNHRVVKLAAGSAEQTVLSFGALDRPKGVAVDASGGVYVADTTNKRVVKLAAGSSSQMVLPFTGLTDPSGLAVDVAGAVYVTDGGRVLRLAAGSTKQTVLPVNGLGVTRGVAVDASDAVYLTDYGNNQVVKLTAG